GFATFVIVAVGAFRREDADTARRQGEAGGYALYAWSLLPVHHDPGSAEGRATLGLAPEELEGVAISRFRASRGDDASCLNLHRPRRPTILAPEPAFLAEGRFAFQASLAETPAEHRNPWLLLERDPQDGAIPAIADASSLAYALHRKLGDVMELPEAGVRLRFVGALEPGLLQGEVLVGERAFLRAFPHESGYRFFLVGAPAGRADSVALHLEQRLAAFGFDAAATAARLAAFHRVENTYIATFQALGALGLLLGIVGLASVLIRNALEQRRELALLRAVGYEDRHLLQLLLAENGLVVLLGLAAGVLPALVAIAPAPHGQRGAVPLALVAILGVVVACTGGLVSWLAAVYIRRLPLLASLRAE
ncbi:MAG TPA: ABC transporter permease, partial [Vicinamibacteria bacterium]|nr:ABC transporter permease [Vicinamibacteria bacterium]